MRLQHFIVVRRKGIEGQWLFPLKHIPDSTVVMWPAMEVSIRGQQFFLPDISAEQARPRLEIVWDLSEWEARRIRYLSPIGLFSEFHIQRQDLPKGWCVLAHSADNTENLKVVAARCGFWDFKKPLLDLISKHIGFKMPSGLDEFQTVFVLTKHVLELSDVEILKFLSQRLEVRRGSTTVMEEVLYMDDAV